MRKKKKEEGGDFHFGQNHLKKQLKQQSVSDNNTVMSC